MNWKEAALRDSNRDVKSRLAEKRRKESRARELLDSLDIYLRNCPPAADNRHAQVTSNTIACLIFGDSFWSVAVVSFS